MCPAMSESAPSSFRDSPKVSPAEPDTDERGLAARALLGLDLAPQNLWGNPVRATAYWAWIRDGRNFARDDFASFHEWISTFLGLAGDQSDPTRHFTLGFVQCVECAIRRVPLPAAVLAGVGSRHLPDSSGLPADPGTEPLPALREWATRWLRADAGSWERLGSWVMGVVMAGRATWENHSLCRLLPAESDRVRSEQRFAARALAGFLLHPGADLWQQFVRTTYPDGCPEGRAIAESTRRSLDHARDGRWRLREFLLHAVDAGRDFAGSRPDEAGRVLAIPGTENGPTLAREFSATTGAPGQTPRPEDLLLAVRNWLRERHPDLFESREGDPGNLVLRHAYHYLWWRGLMEVRPSGSI